MKTIEIKCLETERRRSEQIWNDSGKTNILIKKNGKRICLELKNEKKFKEIDRQKEEIEDESVFPKKKRISFILVENVFLNDSIPVYRQE